VRLRSDPRFDRKGRDLHTTVTVPLTTAILGGEAEVPTPGDRPVRLRIPPTTQNGQVFRLKAHGMPAVGKPAERGDLYATVTVTLPRQLTDEQRRHFEELAKLEGQTR
jgi:curved DNA-binding protein